MKKMIAILLAAAGMAAFAEDSAAGYTMYWQVSAANIAPYGDAATYAGLFAQIGDNVIQIGGSQKLSEGLASSSGWNASSVFDNSTFFIELLNDSGTVLAKSLSPVTYSDIINSSFVDVNFEGSGVATTHTSVFTGYFAVPEPTSGMLLLMGGALLALRRKRRA